MLFGTMVVIDGVEHTVPGKRGRTQQHCRLAAVRPDLYAHTVIEVAERSIVECPALIGGHESGDPVGKFEQPSSALGGLGPSRHHLKP
jgi:hypothetical protein